MGVSEERVFHNNKKQTTTQHMAQNAKEVPFDIPCGNFQVGIREYDRNQNSEYGHWNGSSVLCCCNRMPETGTLGRTGLFCTGLETGQSKMEEAASSKSLWIHCSMTG